MSLSTPGNFNCLSRSTFNCQCQAEENKQVDDLRTEVEFSTVLMKYIVFVSGLQPHRWLLRPPLWLISQVLGHFSTRTSLHQVLSDALRMCFSIPFLVQSGYIGVSLIPQVCMFAGLGSTSYTDCTRNLIRLASECQFSDQLIFCRKKNSLTVSMHPAGLIQTSCTFFFPRCWLGRPPELVAVSAYPWLFFLFGC